MNDKDIKLLKISLLSFSLIFWLVFLFPILFIYIILIMLVYGIYLFTTEVIKFRS